MKLKDLIENAKSYTGNLIFNKVTERVGYSEYTQWDTTVSQDVIEMSPEQYEDLIQRIDEFEQFWKDKKAAE